MHKFTIHFILNSLMLFSVVLIKLVPQYFFTEYL